MIDERELRDLVARHADDILARFRACQVEWSAEVWATIWMRYGRNMRQRAIAEALGRSRSAISTRLKRASERLREYESSLRREALEHRRQLMKEEE